MLMSGAAGQVEPWCNFATYFQMKRGKKLFFLTLMTGDLWVERVWTTIIDTVKTSHLSFPASVSTTLLVAGCELQ